MYAIFTDKNCNIISDTQVGTRGKLRDKGGKVMPSCTLVNWLCLLYGIHLSDERSVPETKRITTSQTGSDKPEKCVQVQCLG